MIKPPADKPDAALPRNATIFSKSEMPLADEGEYRWESKWTRLRGIN